LNTFPHLILSALLCAGVGCSAASVAETADERVLVSPIPPSESATQATRPPSAETPAAATPAAASPAVAAENPPLTHSPAAASSAIPSTSQGEQSGSSPLANPVSDAQRLTALLADLDTFTANVRQLIVESTGGVLEESQILFMLRRPHGFYWETLEPFPELIVTDGESLWNYQPDLLQLTIEDWDAERTELAARLLSGRTEALAEEYAISATAIDNRGWEFVLRPLDAASLYERVMLYFDAGELETILLVSTNGQRTFWEFFDRKINIPLDESRFRFTPPEDDSLEILDNRRPR
jgi:outer membrane lipoprotein carrier protein